ncbi:MAG: hypothetical protein ABI837_13960 [Acidobacteriota bacterium]
MTRVIEYVGMRVAPSLLRGLVDPKPPLAQTLGFWSVSPSISGAIESADAHALDRPSAFEPADWSKEGRR